MAKKRENIFLAEWQQIAPVEPDTSPEGEKRTRQDKELFASGIAAALRHAGKHLGKRRYKRLLRQLREFRATYRPIITSALVVRRALELFRNSNAFLRMTDSQHQEAIGSTLKIRLPVDYAVPTDLQR